MKIKSSGLWFALVLITFLTGCENSEQTAKINGLSLELAEKEKTIELKDKEITALTENVNALTEGLETAKSEIQSLTEKMRDNQDKDAELAVIKGYLDDLEGPVSRFRTGVSYRDFSALHASVISTIGKFEREKVAKKYPSISNGLAEVKLDFDTISLLYSEKFGLGSVRDLINPADYIIERYNPKKVWDSDGRWMTNNLLQVVMGATTSHYDEVWDAYSQLRDVMLLLKMKEFLAAIGLTKLLVN